MKRNCVVCGREFYDYDNIGLCSLSCDTEHQDEPEHEPGCPAIADDEGDYNHLSDAGECICNGGRE